MVGSDKTMGDKGKGIWQHAMSKSQIKWDAEGDENSKFFHSFVRRRNNKCNLRGLMDDVVWCEDPKIIKAEMVRHYKNLFSDGGLIRPIFYSNKIEKISVEESRMLEKGFSKTKVWEAICGCWSYRMLLQNYCKNASEKVKKVVGNVVGEVQNAFIKGRYILDGVLIAKETMDYLKIKKGKSLIFKVDFEKATSSMSILVNGSPSEEFGLERDVRQGDPLSPFLFILAAEDLNAIVIEAVEKGIFRGVVVGANNVMVSHLQYADDTIFFGEWNKENAKSLMCILKWGLSIGENMRRVNAWGPVVDKFKNRYGYCKNHKKTVKTGQTRTRERIECTRAGSF
ncbi:reverse transcriptase domain, reverse transcriptase zinc-binding domain protein [Tanacetum coccineum]